MKKVLLILLMIPLVIFLWRLPYVLIIIVFDSLRWENYGLIITDIIYWIYSLGLMLFVFYLFSTEQIDKKLVVSKAKRKKRTLWIIGTEMFLSVIALLAYFLNQPQMGPPFPYFPQVFLAYAIITPFVLLAALVKSITEHFRKNKK